MKLLKQTSKLLFFSMTQQTMRHYSSNLVPKLPLLDDMVAIAQSHPNMPKLDKTAFIGVQHMLETTATLFDSLIHLGVKPRNMHFSGKCYSTSPIIVEEIKKMGVHVMPDILPEEPGEYQAACKLKIRSMWDAFLKNIEKEDVERIVVLDEGGRCLEEMPEHIAFRYSIAGIEQTRGGLYNHCLNDLMIPLIEVASSAVKKIIEPPLIAKAILKKVQDILPELKLGERAVCGVIGNGAIGSAIARHLLSLGYYVTVYDESFDAFNGIDKVVRMPSIKALIANSRCIFSCTGKDITQNIDVLNTIQRDTIFISCSSEDKEFLSLLKEVNSKSLIIANPMSDIICRNERNKKIIIKGGGFPINFDRSTISVPNYDIAITRGLLLGACLQATLVSSKPIEDGLTINNPSRLCLDPYIQSFVLQNWIRGQNENNFKKHITQFNDINWIKENSGGKYHHNEFLYDCYSENNKISFSSVCNEEEAEYRKLKL